MGFIENIGVCELAEEVNKFFTRYYFAKQIRMSQIKKQYAFLDGGSRLGNHVWNVHRPHVFHWGNTMTFIDYVSELPNDVEGFCRPVLSNLNGNGGQIGCVSSVAFVILGLDGNTRPFLADNYFNAVLIGLSLFFENVKSENSYENTAKASQNEQDIRQVCGGGHSTEIASRFLAGVGCFIGSLILFYVATCSSGKRDERIQEWVCGCGSLALLLCGFAMIGLQNYPGRDEQENSKDTYKPSQHADIVPHKYLLTSTNYWGTVLGIEDTHTPNILAADKQVAVISALAEGSGIRQIERMTGVNRNTIMNLGVRVGKGCAALFAVRAAIIQESRNAEAEK